ncbi:MAG: glycerophosphodiester phosphodiesterase [Actinomycetota bacterium]
MRARRLLAATLVAGTIAAAIVPAHASPSPMLIAHRGGAGLWPENTLTAFRNAHALFEDAGVAGWLELDTQLTADGVPVVIHDATLDRTTNCTGSVVSHTAAEVTACDADPGPAFDPVPTLAQVLTEGAAAGWRLVIEAKNIPGEAGFVAGCARLADGLRNAIGAAGFPASDLIVESFWPLCLDRLESTAPAIPTLLLTLSSTINDLSGLATPVPLGFLLAANAAFATVRGYEYSSPDQDTIDLIEPVVTVAHLLGRRVVVWTVDDVARMTALAGIGVDGIISDRPDLLVVAFPS